MFRTLTIRASVAAVVALTIGQAQESQAVFLSGTTGFNVITPITTSPTPVSLATASMLSFPTPSFTINTAGSGTLGAALTTNPATTGSIAPPMIQFTSAAVGAPLANMVTFDFGGGRIFSVPSGSAAGFIGGRTLNPSNGNNSLTIFLSGTYSGFAGFDPTPGTATLTFDQTGTAISGSATLEAVPPTAVPVPATALLAGVGGLFMVGVRRIRRAA